MANGNFAGGDGSVNNPYLIEDVFDLNAVRNHLSASYKLIKDIDLNISPYNEGTGWVPIGTSGTGLYFNGIFDGNGHIIKNLYIHKTTTNYTGLFGYASNSIIKNIRLENVNITGARYTGGLVGLCTGNNIISNSYSTGNISGTTYVGGLTGGGSNYTILNSYSNVIVNGNDYIGGLTGSCISGTILNCYSTSVTISADHAGGLIGYNSGSTVNYSYWDIDISGQSTSTGGTGLTTAQMKTPSSFVNWNTQILEDGITKIWILKEGKYPKLYFEKLISFLIRQNDQYNSIKEDFYDEINDTYNSPLIPVLDINNFNTYGITNLSKIHINAFNKLINDKFNMSILK